MNAERLVEDSLRDILEATRKAIEFVDEMDSENLADDDKTECAVIRALEIVGEAARRIPGSFREKRSQILPFRFAIADCSPRLAGSHGNDGREPA